MDPVGRQHAVGADLAPVLEAEEHPPPVLCLGLLVVGEHFHAHAVLPEGDGVPSGFDLGLMRVVGCVFFFF